MTALSLWCVEAPDGNLMIDTLADTKADALFGLFGYMTEEFQMKHWKNIKSSNAAYKKLGYKAVRVRVVKTSGVDTLEWKNG